MARSWHTIAVVIDTMIEEEDGAARREHPCSPSLVADIGGTYARFGLVQAPRDPRERRPCDSLVVHEVERFVCAEHAGPVQAAQAYLGSRNATVCHAAIAVAGPVLGDRVALTNSSWSFSRRHLRQALSLDQLVVLNDFTALAHALPALEASGIQTFQTGQPAPTAPRAVIGPGTGLGVSALLPRANGARALSTEGGHRDLAATNDREWEVIRALSASRGRVSAETVLSGAGLGRIEATVRQLAGERPRELHARDVVAAARRAVEGGAPAPYACEAVHLFTGWLGAVAGDLVLTLGACGGLYLGGGMLPKMAEVFDPQRFLERFLAKGRFQGYLQQVPVHLITDPNASLRGAASALLASDESSP